MRLARVLVGDVRLAVVEVVDADVGDLEVQRQPRAEPRGDQVLDALGLPVDDDAAPAGQLAERDVVPLAVELHVDAVVHDPLAMQPVADAGAVEEVDRALLEDAGADARFDVVAATVLEDDSVDARDVQQLPEREPGRAGADDRDLRPLARQLSSTSCAIANARLAAGTPQ